MKPRGWTVPSGLGITTLLVLATLITRLPFVSQMLYSYDSANYAFAIRDYYNVVHHHPHPPGYPLYVASGWLLSQILGEVNRGLVAVSILASVLAVAATHRLAVAQFGGAIGLAAGLLLLFSTGFWGYGEVAYPYTALAGFGASIAFACHLLRARGDRYAVASGALFGVATGFRLDLVLELGPLWLYGLSRCSWRSRLFTFAVCGVLVALWAIPMIQLSGGVVEYIQALRAQSGYVVGAFSVVSGGETIARYNADLLLHYLRLSIGAPLLLLIYAIGRTLSPARLAIDERLRFLIIWVLPPAAVFLLLHIGDPGYILVIAPALCILAAAALGDLAVDLRAVADVIASRTSKAFGHSAKTTARLAPALLLAGLIVWNTDTFLHDAGPTRRWEIQHIDRLLASQVKFILESFEPGQAVLLAHDRARQLQYYAGGHPLVLFFDEYEPGYRDRTRTLQLPEGTQVVVIADGSPSLGPRAAAASRDVPLYDAIGGTVRVLDTRGSGSLEYGYGKVELGD